MFFSKWRQFSSLGDFLNKSPHIRLLIPPLVFLILLFAPFELPGLENEAKTFLAIFVLVALQWLITPIPMFASGLMGVGLATVFGVTTPQAALAPFAHPIIFLFLGGFLLAKAMEELGLDKKLSLKIITHPLVQGDFKRTFIAIIAVTAFFSMWVSNTATTAMMLPIVLGLLKSLDIRDQETKSALLISMAYAATIGGLGTPIGSPPNVIAVGMLRELADIRMTFLAWMAMGTPLVILSLSFLVWHTLRKVPDEVLLRPFDTSGFKNLYTSSLSRSEYLVIAVFIATIFFWFLPSMTDILIPNSTVNSWAQKYLDASIVVLLTISPLFIFPLKGPKKILHSESVKNIDWGSLLLFGSGLSLGGLLFSTGIAGLAGQYLVEGLGGGNFFWAMALIIAATVFFTEFTSNTASANILLPIIIAATLALQISPLGPALMVALACNLAFMLPVATPPNAIVYGSGEIQFKDLLRKGLLMNLFGIVLITTTMKIFLLLN